MVEEKKILERDLEAHFSKECKRLKIPTLKLNVRFSRGWPDRLVLKHYKTGLVELKTETGRLSDLQERVHMQLKSVGFTVHVLRTKQDITKYLEEFNNVNTSNIT